MLIKRSEFSFGFIVVRDVYRKNPDPLAEGSRSVHKQTRTQNTGEQKCQSLLE